MRAHVHRWTPIVAGIALVAAALLPAVPIDASHSKWEIHHGTGAQGDTYVFKLESDEDFTIKQGSTIGLSATYDEKRRDMAFAFAWTDLDDDHTQILGYDATRDPDETHVKLLTDTEHAIEYNDSRDDGDPLTPGTIGTGIKFDDDVTFDAGTWYFVLSAPEADSIGVSILLNIDRDLSIAGEAKADTGTILPEDAFDGTGQVDHNQAGLTGVRMESGANVSNGNRSFASLMPDRTLAGAGYYGIDGPGDADDEVLGADTWNPSAPILDMNPELATVLAGPPGDYRFWVDADAWATPYRFGSGERVGVLYAAPIPF